jgi:hypothetical protein
MANMVPDTNIDPSSEQRLTTPRSSGILEPCSIAETRSSGEGDGDQEDGMTEEMMAEREDERFWAPRGSLSKGRMEFARGVARLTLGGAEIPELFRARFDRPAPSVSVHEGKVTVRYPRFSLRGWPRPWVRREGQVTLNKDVSWDLSIQGGVAQLEADLRGLQVEAIEVSHGASRLDLRLPRPSGVVPVRIGGGASHVRIRRPAGTPARLRIGRGVTDLTLDEQEFGAVGGRLRLESRQADAADSRYEIEITGGASHVQVTTE